jgi:hypothetical protein
LPAIIMKMIVAPRIYPFNTTKPATTYGGRGAVAKTDALKRVVDALRPSARRDVAWDTELSGYGLRVQPSGERVYVLKDRHEGCQAWVTIGRHGSRGRRKPHDGQWQLSLGVRVLGERAIVERKVIIKADK